MKNKALLIALLSSLIQIVMSIVMLIKGFGSPWFVVLIWALVSIVLILYCMSLKNMVNTYYELIDSLTDEKMKLQSSVTDLSYHNRRLKKQISNIQKSK